MAAGLNHVSVIAHDLVESTCFHVDELGLAPLPTAESGFPVIWPPDVLPQEREAARVTPWHAQ